MKNHIRLATLVLASFVLVVTGALASGPEGGGSPATTLTVTPSDDLDASQSVSVSGSGFTANTMVELTQCNADGSVCTLPIGGPTANASGSFSTTVSVTSTLTASDSTLVNCRQVSCAVYAVSQGTGVNAHHHLSFRVPIATTGSATNVSSSAARLEGQINPNGFATTGFAEYSNSSTLASPTSTPPVSMGSAIGAVSFAAAVSGLLPDATYFYRVVATGSDGTVVRGGIVNFKTTAAGGGGGGSGGGGAGGGGGPQSTCGGKKATIIGTPGADNLKGTGKADVIVGLGGRDRLSGRGGNDRICGGAGADRISGGKGKDRLYGDAGNDQVSGGPGRDRLYGGSGRDKLNGGASRDILSGGPGTDRCSGKDRKRSC